MFCVPSQMPFYGLYCFRLVYLPLSERESKYLRATGLDEKISGCGTKSKYGVIYTVWGLVYAFPYIHSSACI